MFTGIPGKSSSNSIRDRLTQLDAFDRDFPVKLNRLNQLIQQIDSKPPAQSKLTIQTTIIDQNNLSFRIQQTTKINTANATAT